MADPIYVIPENPSYDPNIRALQDGDPARASTVFNPVLGKIIENTHAVKLAGDANASRIEEVAEQAGQAGSADNITLPGGQTVSEAIGGLEESKAGLDSPALTGTPTAPTAAKNANSTQVATTAFVKSQGYSTTDSPTFTGSPKAPTPATGSNDTRIATTAFVKAQGYATAEQLNAALEELSTNGSAYKLVAAAASWQKGAVNAQNQYWYELAVANAEIAAGDVVLVFPGDTAAEALFGTNIRSLPETYAGGFKLLANTQPTSSLTIYYTISKQEG
ncbi:hypothetical protein [Clostridium sp. D33t1_170424_F3]|uniref:hypothetical protein n=1 Tax=Clostridium sp. D33t1_170424_F3 TaxID=2787099 RepID=UPI0018AC7F5B|nr:hypothetical protein [Clostridium sp. D33t1_170424_F3]